MGKKSKNTIEKFLTVSAFYLSEYNYLKKYIYLYVFMIIARKEMHWISITNDSQKMDGLIFKLQTTSSN